MASSDPLQGPLNRLSFAEGGALPAGIVLVSELPEAALERLSPEERDRHEGFPAAKRKNDWLLGRLAGKQALRHHGIEAPDPELAIVSAPSGAPRLAGPGADLAITITHGHGYAAAWATRPGDEGGLPGLDLERVKKRPEGTFRFYLHPEERAWLGRHSGERAGEGEVSPRDLAGIVAWALKEAAFKALQPPRGTGLLDVGLELESASEAPSGRARVVYLNAAAPRADALGVRDVEAGWERRGAFVLAWVYARGARLPG